MVRTAIVAIGLVLTSIPVSTAAQGIDFNVGNGFWSECRDYANQRGTYSHGICMGMLQGIVNLDDLRSQTFYCMPTSATYGQMMDVFLAYLRANPSERHLPTSVLMALAFADAWPCRHNDQ